MSIKKRARLVFYKNKISFHKDNRPNQRKCNKLVQIRLKTKHFWMTLESLKKNLLRKRHKEKPNNRFLNTQRKDRKNLSMLKMPRVPWLLVMRIILEWPNRFLQNPKWLFLQLKSRELNRIRKKEHSQHKIHIYYKQQLQFHR